MKEFESATQGSDNVTNGQRHFLEAVDTVNDPVDSNQLILPVAEGDGIIFELSKGHVSREKIVDLSG